MSKTKKQIILFIIIIVLGVAYSINEYVITPGKLSMEKKAAEVQSNNEKLKLLKSQSLQVDTLSAEVEKLKQASNAIGTVTVTDINTPQLVYDFYNSCIKYGIKGENLIFQLDDITKKTDKAANGKKVVDSSEKNNEMTNPSNIPNNPVNQPANISSDQFNNSINQTGDVNNATEIPGLSKLTIKLKVSGDKNKVEKFVRSLNALTERKINVKSIRLESNVSQISNTNSNNNTSMNSTLKTVASTNATMGNKTTSAAAQPQGSQAPSNSTTVVNDQISADIIFNQYIYYDGKTVVRESNYNFYNGQTGFQNFSDMFK